MHFFRGKEKKWEKEREKGDYEPLRAMTLETGFMMAASAEIFCLVTELPASKSTMAICCVPPTFSQTVINLSDSNEQEPNFTLSPGIDNGGFVSCRGGTMFEYKLC
jgi:hypothetical protein